MSELDQAKQEFKQDMDKSLDLIKQVNKMSSSLSADVICSIYELSFLKIYLFWESFINKVFILYMMGKKTDSGYAPKCYVSPKDEKHAYQLIKGHRPFADWLNLEFVRETAELFFENGEPFKPMLYEKSNIKEALQNMKKLRNKIVHASQEAEENYKKLLRDEFGSASKITPGEFLSKMRNKGPKEEYIVYYKEVLKAASDGIVR